MINADLLSRRMREAYDGVVQMSEDAKAVQEAGRAVQEASKAASNLTDKLGRPRSIS